MSYIIETQNLVKTYKYKNAVDNVSIHIEKGEIYGLIGKNGAGKTTLLKLLLGLVRPNSGKMIFFDGMPLDEARHKIGSLIEAPGLYLGKTAKENLVEFSILFNAPVSDVDGLLKLVGLENVGAKKVKAFSLGMKQRLGLAVALIGNPDILLLDEPINGLDPEGIASFRKIIEDIHKERNVTMIISSHLLDELGKVATKYGIINNGKLVEEITVGELDKLCGAFIKVQTSNNSKALELIKENFKEFESEIVGDMIKVKAPADYKRKISALLLKNEIDIDAINEEHNDPEGFFIERLK